MTLRSVITVLSSLAAGSLGTIAVLRARGARNARDAKGTVTRVDAHLAPGSASMARFTPAKSIALQREAQAVFEHKEATHDLAVLDRQLIDIRDLSGADEAIFWRWVETRQTLVPAAWSSGGERPAFFNVRAWGALVRWSAEETQLQFAGDIDGMPEMASAPVLIGGVVYGVLTLTATSGLHLDRDALKTWLPRFASQVASLQELFDLRREYGRRMRQSGALLDAVQRMHGHRSAETLAQSICETAHDVTSAPVAALVRWNPAERHGVLQAISPAAGIDAGFHVTAESLVGRACDSGLAMLLEDARSATNDADPYGGLPRPIGSLAIAPVRSGDEIIGAVVVEGAEPGDIAQVEARNVSLLGAVARGPLEIVWEIEEVSRRARTDALTGLANRRHFDEQMRRVVAETDRFGGCCSLVLVDLDHFKSVNDTFGHEAGDAVLKHVAQILFDGVRTVDICARYGGEELAVLLPQTTEQGAYELAERLRQTLEQRPSSHAGRSIPVTASFGVATYPKPVPYGDWLVLAADKALYEAKETGRNRVKAIQANQVTPALYKAR